MYHTCENIERGIGVGVGMNDWNGDVGTGRATKSAVSIAGFTSVPQYQMYGH